jgi:hypothetical protein
MAGTTEAMLDRYVANPSLKAQILQTIEDVRADRLGSDQNAIVDQIIARFTNDPAIAARAKAIFEGSVAVSGRWADAALAFSAAFAPDAP